MINDELDQLKRRVAQLEARSSSAPWTSYLRYNGPFILADTYDDLQRINVPAPALGFIRYNMVTTEVPQYNPDGSFKGFLEQTYRVPTARYFVRAYPPVPKIDKIKQPTIDENGVTSETEWRITQYQPSAGMSGALLYFDQGENVGDLDSTLQVDAAVTLEYPTDSVAYQKNSSPMYKITVTKAHLEDPDDEDSGYIIDEMQIDYANGIDTRKLMWLEIDILPPWGHDDNRIPLNADYETVWNLPTLRVESENDA